MRIEKIVIEGLFGLYDHEIPFNLTDRVTILHGPNGVGKTTVLRMIDDLATFDFAVFIEVPFRVWRVVLEGGGSIEVRHGGDEGVMDVTWRADEATPAVTFGIQSEAKTPRSGLLLAAQRLLGTGVGLDGLAESDVPSGPDAWQARLVGSPKPDPRMMSAAADCRRVLQTVLRLSDQRLVKLKGLSPEKSARLGAIARIRDDDIDRSSIAVCARDLEARISHSVRNYGTRARELDQTFPRRALRNPTEPTDISALKLLAAEIEARQERLQELELLTVEPLEELDTEGVDPACLAMLALYLQDTSEKLGVFDDLAERLVLFRSILNRKFQNKHVAFSESEGYRFVDSKDRPIPLTGLSSGEQHEVVMLYHLLFRVEPGTLVLIDEPEMSLHVAWQRDYLDDLVAITRLRRFDVLLASHSPYIVADRWDLTVELSAQTRDEAVA